MGQTESLSFSIDGIKDPYFRNLLDVENRARLYEVWDEIDGSQVNDNPLIIMDDEGLQHDPDSFVTREALIKYFKDDSDQPFFHMMLRAPDILNFAIKFACLDDMTERVLKFQFRALLVSIYVLSNMWKVFVVSDLDSNKKITRAEFIESYVNLKELHGLKFSPNLLMCDWHCEFDNLDDDKNGYISFLELCHWTSDNVIHPEYYVDQKISVHCKDAPVLPLRIFTDHVNIKKENPIFDRLSSTKIHQKKERKSTNTNEALISHLSANSIRWIKQRRASSDRKVVLSPVREKQLRKIFNGIDMKGDGLIDLDDIKMAVTEVQKKLKNVKELASFRDNILDVFRDMDDNGDGEVDFHEFTSAMTGTTKSVLEKSTEHGIGALYQAFVQYGIENKRDHRMNIITGGRGKKILNLKGKERERALPSINRVKNDYDKFCLFNLVFGDEKPLNRNSRGLKSGETDDTESRGSGSTSTHSQSIFEQKTEQRIEKVREIVESFVDENKKPGIAIDDAEGVCDENMATDEKQIGIGEQIDADRMVAFDVHAMLIEELATYNRDNPLNRAVRPTSAMMAKCGPVSPADKLEDEVKIPFPSSGPQPSSCPPSRPSSSNPLYFDCPVAHDVAVSQEAKKEYFKVMRKTSQQRKLSPFFFPEVSGTVGTPDEQGCSYTSASSIRSLQTKASSSAGNPSVYSGVGSKGEHSRTSKTSVSGSLGNGTRVSAVSRLSKASSKDKHTCQTGRSSLTYTVTSTFGTQPRRSHPSPRTAIF